MIDALIFDKDGTLFDFRQSWGEVTHSLAAKLGPYGPGQAALESFLGYDPVAGDFHPDSPVIAQTTPEIAALLHPLLDGISLDEVNDLMNHLAQNTPMVPAVPLRPVLLELRVGGRKLGLATNDTEAPARAHLTRAGVIDLFDFVAGCDSGWGGKPAPGQLVAFLEEFGLTPSRVAMVGDSRHDLEAGRAAGMKTVAVLTGIAGQADLEPHADVVLPNIGHLANWIAQMG